MADLQNSAKLSDLTVIPIPFEMLNSTQRAYVDYKALDGVITDDNGVRPMKVDELANKLGITRQALYQARDSVPNFWDLVAERRKKFGSESRLAYVHKNWYLKAATVKNWPVTEAWLRNNDPNFIDPKVKHEHEAGNSLSELFRQVEQQRKPAAIEAEIVITDAAEQQPDA